LQAFEVFCYRRVKANPLLKAWETAVTQKGSPPRLLAPMRISKGKVEAANQSGGDSGENSVQKMEGCEYSHGYYLSEVESRLFVDNCSIGSNIL